MKKKSPNAHPFVASLNGRIAFHHADKQNPREISIAIIMALTEVRDAFTDSLLNRKATKGQTVKP